MELKKAEMDFIPLLSTLARAFCAADILVFACEWNDKQKQLNSISIGGKQMLQTPKYRSQAISWIAFLVYSRKDNVMQALNCRRKNIKKTNLRLFKLKNTCHELLNLKQRQKTNYKDKEVKHLSFLQNKVSQIKHLLWDNPWVYIKRNNACNRTDAFCTLQLNLMIMLSAGWITDLHYRWWIIHTDLLSKTLCTLK